MILHTTQNEVAKDLHRFRVLRMGRRWGKTTLMSEEVKGVALSKPTRISYIANNYQQARDIAWELFKKEMLGAIVDTNEARLEIKIKNGSLIVLRGWESIENLRGQAFDFLCLDEVAQMSGFWVGWEEVLRPTLTDTKGEALFASTPKGFNHFYDLCNLELTNKDFKTFHFTSYDNPFLDKGEIDNAKESLPDDRFSQEYLAEFTKTTGLVYKEFSRKLHTYDALPNFLFEKAGGIDFGYTNPAAVLDIRHRNGEFWIEDEWYKTQRTEQQIAEYAASCKFNSVYPDPENPSAIEVLRKLNMNVVEVSKGKDSVESGIQKIRELLLANKLHVSGKCINLISEFESYSYPDHKDEKNKIEKPIKLNDHALDALRYTIMTILATNQTEVREKLEQQFNRNQFRQAQNNTR